ncbi:MAG TPA: amino acid adenylation domain-containing protein, partial [Noviherbaspirillum sp.]|nr:amino acid adenylation domain-containing protein [Noviherbaspirillum sp.]
MSIDQDDSLSIAIIGMSGRFPGAGNLDEFWTNIKNGVESIRRLSEEELLSAGISASVFNQRHYVKANAMLAGIDLFDANFFGMTPLEAEITDPQQRLFLECAWEALEHAGYAPGTGEGTIGVYAGANSSSYFLQNVYPNSRVVESVGTMQLGIGNEKDYLSSRTAFHLNLRGPAIAVQSACSTSLVAVHLACQSILNGECEMALAGGVSISTLRKQGYFYTEGGITSPDGHCRAFDAQAEGTVFGDGLGIVVLKSLANARADGDTIHAVIRGSAINNDGADKPGLTAPSINGQAGVILDAQAIAGVETDSITYIETHGTGTALGDPIEIRALQQAFSQSTEKTQFCAIGSLKTNVGHLNVAAGVAGLIKTVLALKHREIPPSLHFNTPSPHIDFSRSPFYVNTALAPWQSGQEPRRAAVSSFGIGGTNAHVILEEAPAAARATSAPAGTLLSRPCQLLPLSAQTPAALDAATNNLKQFLIDHPQLDLADAAYTSQTGRRHFNLRRMLVCSDSQDAIRQLDSSDAGQSATLAGGRATHSMVFMFPGQGTQYVNMAKALYQSEATFRAEVDTCSELLHTWLGRDLRQILFPDATQAEQAAALLQQTHITQPALFVVEYALARQLNEWGIVPAAMLGHSIGEYVAACLAGVFSLADGLALVAQRGKLIASLPAGAMLAVHASEQTVHPLLDEQLWLSAVNAPFMCSVSGSMDAIERLTHRLREQYIDFQPLHTSHAFHSGMMEPILDDFTRCVEKVTLQRPRIPYLSNVSGDWITEEQAVSPAYWAAHLRQTVRFADCLDTLLRQQVPLLLEVGPGRALSSLAKQQAASQQDVVTFPTLPGAASPSCASASLFNALGKLWLYGMPVNWKRLHRNEQRRRIPLPTYPFQRKRYWLEAPAAHRAQESVKPQPVKRKNIADWFYAPSWKRSPATQTSNCAQLTPHLVFSDRYSLSQGLTDSLRQNGEQLILVKQGTDFFAEQPDVYTIDSAQPAHYAQLLYSLLAQQKVPRKITHLWSMTPSRNAQASEQPASRDRLQEDAFYSLLFLAQAIGKLEITSPITLNVVSNGVHAVVGSEALLPEKATILGPCKVIPLEYPHIRCRHIDLAIDDTYQADPRAIHLLMNEINAPVTDAVVAHRGGYRWTQIIEPAGLAPAATPVALRRNGHYLITGGLGGIGFAFAQYLASKAIHPNITLVGRSSLPAPQAWNDYVQTHDEDDPVCRKIRQLQRLEEQGANILYLTADIADEQDVRQLAQTAQSAFGPLHGLFHAAGLPGNALIQDKTPELAYPVMAPKLDGTLFLEHAFESSQPDFLMLCSSISAMKPMAGQVDYCAANAFLDALAHERRLAQTTKLMAINWTAWKEVGMAANLQLAPHLRERHAAYLARGISLDDAPAVFDMLLSNRIPQVIVDPVGFDTPSRSETVSDVLSAMSDMPHTADDAQGARPDLAAAYAAPRNEQEQTLASIWCALFGMAAIGIHDDFFSLGGHSLLATRLMSKVRASFHVDLPVRALFDAPTIAALAQRIAQAQQQDAPPAPLIPLADRTGMLPLSFAQQRLWFIHEHMDGQETTYNMPIALRLDGPVSVAALRGAFDALLMRHDILRTTFVPPAQADGDEAMLRIAPSLRLDIPVIAVTEDQVAQHVGAHAGHVFDLAAGPLIKVSILQLPANRHVVLINTHHIVSDGWSQSIMTHDMQQLYAAQLSGHASALALPALPALPIQYADYAAWQRQQDLSAHLDYWSSALAGYEDGLELPYDYPRPPHRAWRAGVVQYRYPAQLAQQVAQFSQAQQATLFMTLMASMAIVLQRYTGRDDLCIGTTTAGRDRLELEHLIGFFINILPVRIDLSGDPNCMEMLQRVKSVALQAVEHQALPFEHLLNRLPLQRDHSRIPLVPVMLRHQNFPMAALDTWADGVTVQALAGGEKTTTSEIDLQFFGDGAGLSVTVEYAADLFSPATIERLLQHHQDILTSFIATPALSLSQLAMSSPQERQLLAQCNRTERPLERTCVPQLFERQAAATPEALACRSAEGELTYGQLNARANQVAHRLRAAGAGPEVRVGLYLERSLDFVVGLLGVLKAGACYVPLDPQYPAAYLLRILDDAQPQWVLTRAALCAQLDLPQAALLCLDDPALAAQPESNPEVALLPEHVAYVMYTSGSTGQPKGVMVPHGQILNWLLSLRERLPFGADEVVAQKTSAAFAVSVKELLAGLLAGVPQVLIADAAVKDAAAFAAALREARVTRLNIVPSHLQAVLAALGEDVATLRSLRVCITAGEPLTQALRAEVRARLPWVQLWNNYGCTELNDTTYCAPDEQEGMGVFVPIGRPIANTRVFVLDEALRPAPIGVMGELCVESVGMARGYWGQPDLTAERFIPNPFATQPGARLYRTGDMVRRLADGALEYLGRRDFEIKIRGHRIDVRQVEKVLQEHAAVRQAVVAAWPPGAAAQQLVAYVVPAENKPELAALLRRHV